MSTSLRRIFLHPSHFPTPAESEAVLIAFTPALASSSSSSASIAHGGGALPVGFTPLRPQQQHQQQNGGTQHPPPFAAPAPIVPTLGSNEDLITFTPARPSHGGGMPPARGQQHEQASPTDLIAFTPAGPSSRGNGGGGNNINSNSISGPSIRIVPATPLHAGTMAGADLLSGPCETPSAANSSAAAAGNGGGVIDDGGFKVPFAPPQRPRVEAGPEVRIVPPTPMGAAPAHESQTQTQGPEVNIIPPTPLHTTTAARAAVEVSDFS